VATQRLQPRFKSRVLVRANEAARRIVSRIHFKSFRRRVCLMHSCGLKGDRHTGRMRNLWRLPRLLMLLAAFCCLLASGLLAVGCWLLAVGCWVYGAAAFRLKMSSHKCWIHTWQSSCLGAFGRGVKLAREQRNTANSLAHCNWQFSLKCYQKRSSIPPPQPSVGQTANVPGRRMKRVKKLHNKWLWRSWDEIWAEYLRLKWQRDTLITAPRHSAIRQHVSFLVAPQD